MHTLYPKMSNLEEEKLRQFCVSLPKTVLPTLTPSEMTLLTLRILRSFMPTLQARSRGA